MVDENFEPLKHEKKNVNLSGKKQAGLKNHMTDKHKEKPLLQWFSRVTTK